MFQWICKGCGRVWDVSVEECPDCAAGKKARASAARTGVRLRVAAPSRWVLLGGVLALLAVAAYFLLPRAMDSSRPARAGAGGTAATAAAGPAPMPLERIEPLGGVVEVSGLRVSSEADGRAQVQALVTNHGAEELRGLSCRVDLRRAGDEQRTLLASFRFEMQTPLAPGAFQEVRAPLELPSSGNRLPDWKQVAVQLRSCSKQ